MPESVHPRWSSATPASSAGGAAALQSWDPDGRRGAVAVFRQDDARPSIEVGLRNVGGDGLFEVLEAPTGTKVATVSAAQLRSGLRVELPPRGARVLLVVPAA